MTNILLKKNNIYSFLATLSNLLLPVISFPYIVRILGTENIGIYNFSSSFVSYFSIIATMGISTYGIRECSKIINNKYEFERFASNLFSINVYTTILSYVILFISLLFIKKLEQYKLYIILLSTTFAFNTFGMSWLFNAISDFKYISFRTIIFNIISLVLTLTIIKSKSDLYKYTLIYSLNLFVLNVLNFIIIHFKYNISFCLFPQLKKHIKSIIYLFSQSASMLVYTNIDIIMIGFCYDNLSVGMYSISVKIYNVINSLMVTIVNVAIPQLSFDIKNDDYNSFNNRLSYIINFILIVFIPVFFGLNVMCDEIIYFVSGYTYILSVYSLHILTLSMLFSIISCVIGYNIIFPLGFDNVNFHSCIISAICNVLLNIYFIPKYGIVGAAFTTMLSEFLGIINKLKYIDKKICVINFKSMIIRYFCGGILVVCTCILFKMYIVNIHLRLVLAILSSAIVYFIYLIIVKDKYFFELLFKWKD